MRLVLIYNLCCFVFFHFFRENEAIKFADDACVQSSNQKVILVLSPYKGYTSKELLKNSSYVPESKIYDYPVQFSGKSKTADECVTFIGIVI